MKTNEIIHGNAITELRALPDCSIDLIVTDPPYLCRYRDRTGRTVSNDDAPDAVLPVFPELYRVLRADAYCVLFCGWTAIAGFAQAWNDAGFRVLGQIVWKKGYASRRRHLEYRHESAYLLAKGDPRPPAKPLADVQPWTYSGNRNHPTEKSVEIIRPLIERFSAVGDVVLDPFLGSGTTAIAAALAGRSYVGIELERRYCELAEKRLAGVRRFREAHTRVPFAGPAARPGAGTDCFLL